MEAVADNTTQVQDNGAPMAAADPSASVAPAVQTPAASNPEATKEHAPAPAPASTSWKESLSPDLKNSPLLQKFADSPEGLNEALKAHANLESLLGHEKVPIPKSVDDVEGWNRFSKAMGIPDAAEGYGLPDASLPDSMKDISIDKNKFAEVAHAHKLTPEQAKGMWEVYQQENIQAYEKAVEAHQNKMNEVVNTLRGKWGDAYDTNVELGQTVINKFSTDQEMNDYLTATLTQDPRGVEFLSKVGNQFAENKIGEFSMKRFSLSPDQATEEIAKITRDPDHPYNSEKATPKEHTAAIDYVNSLYAAANRARG